MSTEFRAGQRLWAELRQRSKKSRRLFACVGYVGRNPLEVLRWRRGDTLIADLSPEVVSRGICSARGALELLAHGVQVLHRPGLHAKVYLFDSAAIVCSANASDSSASRIEAGLVVVGERMRPIRAWAAGLKVSDETVRLDRSVLQELAKLEPKPAGRPRQAAAPRRKGRKPHGTTWVVSTSLDEDETQAEASAAAVAVRSLTKTGSVAGPSDVDWLNAVGKAVFRNVEPGDTVVEVWGALPYHPYGKLVGPKRCLIPVDLGARFKERRLRLALSDRGATSRRLSRVQIQTLVRLLGLKTTQVRKELVRAPDSAAAFVERVLSG